jgi:Mg2+ and Co2+ transporter CorA
MTWRSCCGAMTAWSGWTSPTEVFNFHPLAIKDALERNRVPKLQAYADHVFLVLHAPKLGRRGHVHYIELDRSSVGATW